MLDTTATNLDAVNRVLGSIGDSPVDTLESPTNVNVINAIKELEYISRKEQSKGWSFNIIDSYTLNADTNTHRISWSTRFLSVVDTVGDKVFIHKGAYLYNLTDQTFTFNNSITVQMILLMDLEELPEVMQTYIVARTGEMFQMKFLGDQSLSQALELERRDAWAAIQDYECSSNTDTFNIWNDEDMQKIRRP